MKFLENNFFGQSWVKTKRANLLFDRQFYPDQEKIIELSYVNFNYLSLEVYRLPDTSDLWFARSDYDIANELFKDNKSKAIIKKNISLDAPLNIEKEYKFLFKAPKAGSYLFCCKDEQDSIMSIGRFVVSNIASVYRDINGKKEVYIVDFKSGKPYSEITMIAKSSKSNTKYLDNIKLNNFTTYFNDIQGIEGQYKVRTESKSDKFSCPTYFYFSKGSSVTTKREDENKIAIFTDRFHYSQLDTIHFRAYVHTLGDNAKMLEGVENKFKFVSPKGSIIATSNIIKSDEWGGYSGSFIVPSDGVGGRYAIRLDGKSNLYGKNYIYVDDLREKSFDITLRTDKNTFYLNGERVYVKGSIKSYEGYDVDGATVKVKVEGIKNRGFNKEREVFSSEFLCDKDGVFTFDFNTLLPADGYSLNSYNICATVTDKRGETLSKDIIIYAYKNRYQFKSDITSLVAKEKCGSITVDVKSCFTKDFSDIKGEYQILTRDSVKVLSGDFISFVPFSVDWERIDNGDYILSLSAGDTKNICKDFTLFSIHDKETPNDKPLFLYSLNDEVGSENVIDFLIGTSQEKLYTVIELSDKDKNFVYQKSVVLDKGMQRYSIPFLKEYGDNVLLNIATVYDGECIRRNVKYYRITDSMKRGLNMKFIPLRDNGTTGDKERFYIEVTDNDGVGQVANITLTAYGKSSDAKIVGELSYSGLNTKDDNLPIIYYRSGDTFNKELLSMDFSRKYYKGGKSTHSDSNFYNGVSIHHSKSDEELIIQANYDIISLEMEDYTIDDLRSTVIFKTDIVTDENGRALVEFTYPNKLATYNVCAVAVTKDARSAVCHLK